MSTKIAVKIHAATETKTITRREYSFEALCEVLGLEGLIDIPPNHRTNIRIYMRVPGGGDWSNTDLDVEGGPPLIVEIAETIRSETDFATNPQETENG